ncbi:hypothetical protein, partial [Treponema endosymbiont of Eucomonympha sp.]|uniref:hypothetical protein n=1 Tax=Treponema endosymbiont of Eucomonympha sp. TaxID=1580831 RepID=UPI000A74D27D
VSLLRFDDYLVHVSLFINNIVISDIWILPVFFFKKSLKLRVPLSGFVYRVECVSKRAYRNFFAFFYRRACSCGVKPY